MSWEGIWGLSWWCKHNLRRCFQDVDVYAECVFLPPPLTEENWMSPRQGCLLAKFGSFSTEVMGFRSYDLHVKSNFEDFKILILLRRQVQTPQKYIYLSLHLRLDSNISSSKLSKRNDTIAQFKQVLQGASSASPSPRPPNRFCKSYHRFGAASLTTSVVCASVELQISRIFWERELDHHPPFFGWVSKDI